jgi:hypothetical protein
VRNRPDVGLGGWVGAEQLGDVGLRESAERETNRWHVPTQVGEKVAQRMTTGQLAAAVAGDGHDRKVARASE